METAADPNPTPVTDKIREAIKETWLHWRATQPLIGGSDGHIPADEWTASVSDGQLVRRKELRIDTGTPAGIRTGDLQLTFFGPNPTITGTCKWRATSEQIEITDVRLRTSENGGDRDLVLEDDDLAGLRWMLETYAMRQDGGSIATAPA